MASASVMLDPGKSGLAQLAHSSVDTAKLAGMAWASPDFWLKSGFTSVKTESETISKYSYFSPELAQVFGRQFGKQLLATGTALAKFSERELALAREMGLHKQLAEAKGWKNFVNEVQQNYKLYGYEKPPDEKQIMEDVMTGIVAAQGAVGAAQMISLIQKKGLNKYFAKELMDLSTSWKAYEKAVNKIAPEMINKGDWIGAAQVLSESISGVKAAQTALFSRLGAMGVDVNLAYLERQKINEMSKMASRIALMDYLEDGKIDKDVTKNLIRSVYKLSQMNGIEKPLELFHHQLSFAVPDKETANMLTKAIGKRVDPNSWIDLEYALQEI